MVDDPFGFLSTRGSRRGDSAAPRCDPAVIHVIIGSLRRYSGSGRNLKACQLRYRRTVIPSRACTGRTGYLKRFDWLITELSARCCTSVAAEVHSIYMAVEGLAASLLDDRNALRLSAVISAVSLLPSPCITRGHLTG